MAADIVSLSQEHVQTVQEDRQDAQKRRHNEKMQFNAEMEEEHVIGLELDRLDMPSRDLDVLPLALYTGLTAEQQLSNLISVV